MSALSFSTPCVCQTGDDVPPVSPRAQAAAVEIKRDSPPVVAAAEHLARPRVPQRPGAVMPRRPLNTLPSPRGAAHTPAAAVPQPDASHHAVTPDAPTRSHAISAALTVNSTLDTDLSERPDTLALPQFPTVTPDLRKPDARALAELEAASRLRKNA
jgi:hypothetical protein